MPQFSKRSIERLGTCHEDLVRLFRRVVTGYDCTVLKGHRGREEQNAAFDRGASRLRWPKGNHNAMPSLAVDVAPYPVNWGGPLIKGGRLDKANLEALKRFMVFGGYVKGVASELGLAIRWGGDWDSDWKFDDQRFNDLVHFELRQ